MPADYGENLMRIVGRVIKYIFIAMIIGVFLIFLFRCAVMKDPASMTVLLASDEMKEIYSRNGSLEAYTQDMVNGVISQDGRFYTTGLIILPETEELVITLRYNDSVLTSMAEKYGLSEVYGSEEYFSYYLRDSEGNTYEPETIVSERKWRYSYRRMRFSGIDVSKYTDVALCVRYIGSGEDEEDFGSVFAYHQDWVKKAYKLTGADRKELEK